MPEDERPPPADHLTSDERLVLLEHGSVEIEGRMPWSSNGTYLVTLESGGDALWAIYKPDAAVRPLWDFDGGLARREVAAYELSVAMGLELVPETVLREGPLGEGSFQRFIDADFSEHYFSLREQPAFDETLRIFGGFDVLANNADRKGGHLLLDLKGAVWGIDHGLCFHEQDKLRTVIWDFAGDELPEAIVVASEALVDDVPATLRRLLTSGEQAALQARARRVLDERRFPCPDLDGRPYPWPLV